MWRKENRKTVRKREKEDETNGRKQIKQKMGKNVADRIAGFSDFVHRPVL
jgi:hypothetical protein